MASTTTTATIQAQVGTAANMPALDLALVLPWMFEVEPGVDFRVESTFELVVEVDPGAL
jgi:hypothetical protein